MKNIEIELTGKFDLPRIERAIVLAIQEVGLTVRMRASLAKFPGCVHWHVKNGREAGTLEITVWPQHERAWFTIQSGRKGNWIEEKIGELDLRIRGYLRRRQKTPHPTLSPSTGRGDKKGRTMAR